MSSLILLLMLCQAPQPQLSLVVTEAGYYFVSVDETGKPFLYPVQQVLVVGKPTVTPPISQPPTTNPAGATALIKKLLVDLSPEAKADLPAVRKAIKDAADMAAAGKFKSIAELEVVTTAFMSLAMKNRDQWGVFGPAVDAFLTKLQNEKIITTVAQYGLILAEIAKAME